MISLAVAGKLAVRRCHESQLSLIIHRLPRQQGRLSWPHRRSVAASCSWIQSFALAGPHVAADLQRVAEDEAVLVHPAPPGANPPALARVVRLLRLPRSLSAKDGRRSRLSKRSPRTIFSGAPPPDWLRSWPRWPHGRPPALPAGAHRRHSIKVLPGISGGLSGGLMQKYILHDSSHMANHQYLN